MKPMSKKQYNDHLAALNLSIVGAAPVLGISRRHSQRFASGEAAVHPTVAKLLIIMVKYKVDLTDKDIQ